MQLTSQNKSYAGTAEAALAASHTGTGAALYPINCAGTAGTMDSIANFTLGDGLAAADDEAVALVVLNELLLLFHG